MMRKVTRCVTRQLTAAAPSTQQCQQRGFLAASTTVLQQRQQGSDAPAKLARVYLMELNKIRSEARMAEGDPMKRNELESRIMATPLRSVNGLDAKVVSQVLSALELVGASGSTLIVDECVSWIIAHHRDVKPVLMVAMCKALNSLMCPRRMEALTALAETATIAVDGMNHSTAIGLLAAYVAEAPRSPLIAHLIPKVRHGLDETVASDAAELWASVSAVNARQNEDLRNLLTDLADRQSMSSMIEMAQPGDLPKLLRGVVMFAQKNQAIKQDILAAMEKRPMEFTLSQVAEAAAATTHGSATADAPLRERAVALLSGRLVSEGSQPALADLAAVINAFVALKHTLPEELLNSLSTTVAKSQPRAWTPHVTARVIGNLEKIAKIAENAAPAKVALGQVIDKCFPRGSSDDQSGFWLAARMRASVMEARAEDIRNIALHSCGSWSPSEVIAFLKAASHVPTADARKLLRDLAPKIIDRVQTADALLLSSVAAAYGRARVRHENLCTAISDRAVATKELLGVYEVSMILAALAAVEHRNTKCFLDLIPSIRTNLHRCTATQATSLITAYAKMSIWNYRLFSRLGDRALAVADQLSTQQVIAIVASLSKMDVRHEALMDKLCQLSGAAVEHCTLPEAIGLLSAFSKTNVWDVKMFETLGKVVVAHQAQLDASQLGEALMAFARADLKAHGIFQDLSLTSLALAPTCPPLPLAAIITAYASVHCQQVELFNVLAERALALKDECPAVTLSAVLVAFATVGIKNDKLFIEMIPRMRHVTYYGGPQDVANVLVAYTNVGLWHYKLFVRLADRAIAVRGDCQGAHLAKILGAFAKVEMRYEKLFTEMSIKIQSIAKTLNPGELATIANAYATAKIFDGNVFNELVQRAISVASTFEPQERDLFLGACKKAQQFPAELEGAFPNWAEKDATVAAAGEKLSEMEAQPNAPL